MAAVGRVGPGPSGRAMTTRWLFGDQLGPHFLDSAGPDKSGSVLLIESKGVFGRRRFHRQKAHLVLSAMRHRAVELGEQCRYVRAETYAEALTAESARLERRSTGGSRSTNPPFSVVHPTSRAALAFVQARSDVEVLPVRGYVTATADFERWASGRRRLLLEDFYRDARRRHDILMDGAEPAGGRWNFDAENREPPPKGASTLDLSLPWWPEEDEIDEEVRRDLDDWERSGDVSFVGNDGPRRFAATRGEAVAALHRFVDGRLSAFGPHEDAMLSGDDWMAHSLLSAPMNLGLLDPLEVVGAAEAAYRAGRAPLASVEGFVRQVMGWRDYVWHLYWHQPDSYRRGNALRATTPLPKWFVELDADAVDARCLSETLRLVRDHGWVHHIPRLMVLGNYAMQRGWSPAEVLDWFHRSFVDGYDWVMVPNVIGMSQYADNGIMATKPYASGGAYINRMSDYCGGCRYDPKKRLGEDACPFTAGYWAFIDRNAERLRGNQRIAQSIAGAARLQDLPAVVEQELIRGSRAP
ncbi:MAG: cryptochrome/photolyase family protein [Pseudonocardiales bacterium]|nr:cryptochrome/photolyase family protein [Pseudonocardiales bacterium]